jgi:hypothetical protein
MAAPLPLSDLLGARDSRWPRHHERSLDLARQRARPGDAWAVISYWRPELPVAASWSQFDSINEGLNRGRAEEQINVQTLVAHFDGGPHARTRFEPWAFLLGDVKLELCRPMLLLLHTNLAFWSDGAAVHAVTRFRTRNLGAYSSGSIASAIREASSARL